MHINSLAVLLGCAGLAVGGVGLIARDIHPLDPNAGPVEVRESPRASTWPPHRLAAGVEFHDEMLDLISRGPPPPRRSAPASEEPQTVGMREPQTVGARQRNNTEQANPASTEGIRFIRTVRGSRRRAQFVEIEFVDARGELHVRRYPVNRPITGADAIQEDDRAEADRSELQNHGYSSRRSRRRGHRRW